MSIPHSWMIPFPRYTISLSCKSASLFLFFLSKFSVSFLFRFHREGMPYNIPPSPSDSLLPGWQSLGPSMLLQMAQFHSFLWLVIYHCITAPYLLGGRGEENWPFDFIMCVLGCYYEMEWGLQSMSFHGCVISRENSIRWSLLLSNSSLILLWSNQQSWVSRRGVTSQLGTSVLRPGVLYDQAGLSSWWRSVNVIRLGCRNSFTPIFIPLWFQLLWSPALIQMLVLPFMWAHSYFYFSSLRSWPSATPLHNSSQFGFSILLLATHLHS